MRGTFSHENERGSGMSSRKRRLLLLSSSSLFWLSCMLTVAPSQPQPPEAAPPATPAPSPAPAPGSGAGPAPATPPATPSEIPPSSQPAQQTGPGTPASPPGTTPVPPITVTAPPAMPAPPRTPPAQPAPAATPPEPAPTAPTPPQRTEVPSTPAPAPAAPAPTTAERTQTFDRARDNIFAPLGTAPSTLSREAIEALPQGTNAPVRDVLLQLPGVSQDSGRQRRPACAQRARQCVTIASTASCCLTGSAHSDSSWITSFVGSLSLITGAMPAQYGLRTAGVVDITTATFDNSGQIGVYGGSRETINSNIEYGGTTGSTEYFFTGRYLQNMLWASRTQPRFSTPFTITPTGQKLRLRFDHH